MIDLAKSGETWSGSAIVPGFGLKGTPLAGIAMQGDRISFTLKGALGEPKFTGGLAATAPSPAISCNPETPPPSAC